MGRLASAGKDEEELGWRVMRGDLDRGGGRRENEEVDGCAMREFVVREVRGEYPGDGREL